MDLKRLVNFWIMLLVSAGLLLAPLAAPVLGAPAQATSSQTQAMSMPDDMPCCPDQTKNKNCEGCPFVALCMLTASLLGPASAASLIERHSVRDALLPADDLLADGLGAKPPDHPPRTNV